MSESKSLHTRKLSLLLYNLNRQKINAYGYEENVKKQIKKKINKQIPLIKGKQMHNKHFIIK